MNDASSMEKCCLSYVEKILIIKITTKFLLYWTMWNYDRNYNVCCNSVWFNITRILLQFLLQSCLRIDLKKDIGVGLYFSGFVLAIFVSVTANKLTYSQAISCQWLQSTNRCNLMFKWFISIGTYTASLDKYCLKLQIYLSSNAIRIFTGVTHVATMRGFVKFIIVL